MVNEENNNTIFLSHVRRSGPEEKNLNGEYLVIQKQEKKEDKKDQREKRKRKKNWRWLPRVQKSWIHHIPPHNKPICGCLIAGSLSCPAGVSRYVVEMPGSKFPAYFYEGKMVSGRQLRLGLLDTHSEVNCMFLKPGC